MRTLRGCFELARPHNAVAAGLLTFIGAFVAAGPGVTSTMALAAILATILATAAGNAINDYFDAEVDAKNRPDRPIPRGAVSKRLALLYASWLFLGAVLLAVTLPLLALAIAGINLVALVTYTQWFKGTPGLGNVLVAYLTGSAVLFGAAAVEAIHAVWPLFGLAAGATFTREVIKDVEDRAGDDAAGLRTLPIVIGTDRAVMVAMAVLIVAVLASPLPLVFGTFGDTTVVAGVYLAIVGMADGLMLWAGYIGRDQPSRSQRWLKVGMFVAAIGFVAARAVTLV